jgi:hypothetical protein
MGKYGKNNNEELNHGILSAAWPQPNGPDRIQPRSHEGHEEERGGIEPLSSPMGTDGKIWEK